MSTLVRVGSSLGLAIVVVGESRRDWNRGRSNKGGSSSRGRRGGSSSYKS